MTTVLSVSAREMEKQTGLKSALGYALPEEDKILIRNNLSKKKKKEVLKHEVEHIERGEEGPFLNFLIPAVGAIGGALLSKKSADKATNAQVAAADQEIAFARESRDLARGDAAPYREAGVTALDALMSMTGLAAPKREGVSPRGARFQGPRQIRGVDYLRGLRGRNYGGQIYNRNDGGQLYNINETAPENVYSKGSYTRTSMPRTIPADNRGYVAPNIKGRYLGGQLPGAYSKITPTVGRNAPPRVLPGSTNNGTTIDNETGSLVAPRENPGGVEGGYNFQTDPGYNFRIGEGQRAIERGAAAAGGLLSGGYGRRLTRYAQDYASNEYTNVYNRIANIAGLGQVSAGQSGNAALITGQQMGNAANNAGYARASGYTAAGNAISGGLNELAKLPWETIFGNQRGTVPDYGLPEGYT